MPRSSQAPRLARQRLVVAFAAVLDALELQNAKLLVTELATNAFIHGRGRIELHAHLDRDRLHVEVIDQGPGFTWTSRERDLGMPGGQGLRIVDAEASTWGIHEGGRHVWFELRRRRAALTLGEAPPQ